MRRAILPAILVVVAGGLLVAFEPFSGSHRAPHLQATTPQAAVQGHAALEARWLAAVDAWESGKYPDALRSLIALASDPAARDLHDRIALLTGGLFPTTEITPAGFAPQISRDGAYVAYETRQGGTTTHIVAVRPSVREITTIQSDLVVFNTTGRALAWVRRPSASSPGTSQIFVRDLPSGTDEPRLTTPLRIASLIWAGDGRLLFVASDPNDSAQSDIHVLAEDGTAKPLTSAAGIKTSVFVTPTGAIVYTTLTRPASASNGSTFPAPVTSIGVLDPTTGTTRSIPNIVTGSLTMSADGRTMSWIETTSEDAATLFVADAPFEMPIPIRRVSGVQRIAAPTLSPDGRLVAYQFQGVLGSAVDWDIYLSDRAGTHRRITRDVQHDLLPRFLTNTTLLAVIGEVRHRRSQLYDLETGTRSRLFANDTIRTISPEYAWIPNADGTALVIQADRDGDVLSPQRGIYLLDLTQKVSPADLSARLRQQLDVESDLRTRMTAAYRPLESQIRPLVANVSAHRVYECQKTMASFDSKYAGEPGNAKAIEYLRQMYTSFGYTPELQTMAIRGAAGASTSNVVATLGGARDPDIRYVVSAHFDSVLGGTGADDNTSGTCALLETARVLAATPLPATVMFASFTSEEAGLLGSEEFVRLAAERKWQMAGALNNDMVGWSGDTARLDNTVRYSNPGIRDLQLGAGFLFSDLVLFDARYQDGTDAASFYRAWGDVVAGIGSYPILGNPNYHRPTDLPETVNVRQIAETAKVTAASAVALASSPSRVKNLKAVKAGATTAVTWTANPETGITGYVVTVGSSTNPSEQRMTTRNPSLTLPDLSAGMIIAVKAVNDRGLESWDWARASVQ